MAARKYGSQPCRTLGGMIRKQTGAEVANIRLSFRFPEKDAKIIHISLAFASLIIVVQDCKLFIYAYNI